VSDRTGTVTKAVIPAAGYGTRFLPAAKAVPKEMIAVVDRPAIQYMVEEAVRAGLDDILLVTSQGKESLTDHFDRNIELEIALEAKGKDEELDEIQRLAGLGSVHAVRQGEQLGLGHAVLQAQHHVGDSPFAVLLGDDIIDPAEPFLERMLATFAETGRAVVAVMPVPEDQVHLYGVVAGEARDRFGIDSELPVAHQGFARKLEENSVEARARHWAGRSDRGLDGKVAHLSQETPPCQASCLRIRGGLAVLSGNRLGLADARRGGDFGGEVALLLLDALAELEANIGLERDRRAGSLRLSRDDVFHLGLVVHHEEL
jgi:hypothetical protein